MKAGAGELFIGLDLGQKLDFSTFAVVERLLGSLLRRLERLNLNTPYPAVAAHARDLLGKTANHGNAKLVIDATGVGAPVLDLLHAQGVCPVAITITAGRSVSGAGPHFHVPKRVLMRTLAALFGAGRFKIASGIPNSAELIEELLNLQAKIDRRTRQDSYGAKGKQKHDDLVLALALAIWYGEKERADGGEQADDGRREKDEHPEASRIV